MSYISGFDRNQSCLFSFDDFILPNNPVRLIDTFVNFLDLDSLGFVVYSPSARGQQPYKRSDLLKLNIYGYVNGIRSSRKLATEARRNIELMWLLNSVTPAKSCIADFVKQNQAPIKNVFKRFIDFLKFANYIDCKSVVIDGTKIRAQNSRNKYYSIKKIDATINFFTSQIDKYLAAIKSSEDQQNSDSNIIITFKEKIDNYKQKIEEFSAIKKNMQDNNLTQVTLTDPSSRMMTSHGNSDICFNFQTAVDSKNSLIVASDVVSDINDSNQLENMVTKATENLTTVPESTIADMGYFNSEQIVNCEKRNTKVFVKRPKTKNATNDSRFSIDKFTYDKERNIYICPEGHELSFSRNLRKKKNKSDTESTIVGYEYSCSNCINCKYQGKCTSSVEGRKITRNVFQDVLDSVEKRFKENPDMYTLRKCVVEHPFRNN